MQKNIEIEFKALLTYKQYQKLIGYFNAQNIIPIIQTNYYLDTPAFDIRQKRMALRVREIDTTYELCLKIPQAVGLLEHNLEISHDEFIMIKQRIPLNNEVYRMLQNRYIDCNLIYNFASLTTSRIEFDYKGCLVCLDHSKYFNKEDYEFELETDDYDYGQQIFNDICHDNNLLPSKNVASKVKRTIREYKRLGN